MKLLATRLKNQLRERSREVGRFTFLGTLEISGNLPAAPRLRTLGWLFGEMFLGPTIIPSRPIFSKLPRSFYELVGHTALMYGILELW